MSLDPLWQHASHHPAPPSLHSTPQPVSSLHGWNQCAILLRPAGCVAPARVPTIMLRPGAL
eukprot:11694091-Prorocentrum_lima.AAC.1